MSVPRPVEIARTQLERLGRLTDCVYAVALILIVRWLPLPEESAAVVAGKVWLIDLLTEHAANLVSVFIGVVFVILYWIRSNVLMNYLDRTDGAHTALSIASVFCVLVLLYVVRISGGLTPSSQRASESVAVALIGLAAMAAWWHATRKSLVRPGLSSAEAVRVQVEAFSEPLAALVTLPFAYVGGLSWNLSWLAYIPIAALLRRRGNRT